MRPKEQGLSSQERPLEGRTVEHEGDGAGGGLLSILTRAALTEQQVGLGPNWMQFIELWFCAKHSTSQV